MKLGLNCESGGTTEPLLVRVTFGATELFINESMFCTFVFERPTKTKIPMKSGLKLRKTFVTYTTDRHQL